MDLGILDKLVRNFAHIVVHLCEETEPQHHHLFVEDTLGLELGQLHKDKM